VPARSHSDTYAAKPDTGTVMHPNMIGEAGGGEPHTNIQPYLTANFCIAMVGIFPARD
jgi:microcystin-dependent protein